jgi:hypothetical protein
MTLTKLPCIRWREPGSAPWRVRAAANLGPHQIGRRGVSQNPRDPQLIRPDGRQAARADVDIGRVRESVAADNVDRRLPALDQRGAVVAPVFAVHAVDPRGSHPVEGQMRSSVSRRAPATKRHGRSVFSDPADPYFYRVCGRAGAIGRTLYKWRDCIRSIGLGKTPVRASSCPIHKTVICLRMSGGTGPLRSPTSILTFVSFRTPGSERRELVSGGVRWTDLTPPEWHNRDARAVEDLKRTGAQSTRP